MEPQLEGCGKHDILVEARVRLALQWSRNLRVAESEKPYAFLDISGSFNGAAT